MVPYPTVLYASEHDGPGRVVICVPTHRRPAMLERTLTTLANQEGAPPFSVIVAENESEERLGAATAARFLADGRLKGMCVLASEQGNCVAMNAGFAAALRAYPDLAMLLVIDDDEMACVNWVARMVSAAETTNADIVGGPVLPVIETPGQAKLADHPVFRPAYDKTGAVPMIYGSGNCLLTQRALQQLGPIWFDMRFNRLGGGDTNLFTRAREADLRFHWCQEAVIHEMVTSGRTRTAWILARGLRIGAINYLVERRTDPSVLGALKSSAKSLALLALALPRAAWLIARTKSPLTACHPVLVALGRVLGPLGLEPHQYKPGRAS